MRRRLAPAVVAIGIAGAAGCSGVGDRTGAEATVPAPERREQDGRRPVVRGEPIEVARLEGRIVFDDFEDVYVMDASGTGARTVADRKGSEFDGAWSPDGRWIVYRDSRRGVNVNDEIFVARANGSGARNLTRSPANDWGPDWSPDGRTIAFNSDRDGGRMSGYLVSPDGSHLRRIDAGVWVEYPSFSPDGTKITFMGHDGGDYEVYIADLETGATTKLTETPGSDGWPVWSPDGTTIAFTSERDDCLNSPAPAPCWIDPGGEPGDHHDIWLMGADGSDLRRVSPEYGHFVAWSPDGEHLLVSGSSLYVIRPDGTGRAEVLPGSGGIPDWTAP